MKAEAHGKLRFRFVIRNRPLGRLRRLGELNLGEAARLPERSQALAECASVVVSWLAFQGRL